MRRFEFTGAQEFVMGRRSLAQDSFGKQIFMLLSLQADT